MGTYKVSILADGPSGCQSEKGDGEVVAGCGLPTCPDCVTRRFVHNLATATGSVIKAALLEHWPGTPEMVSDDLLSGVRTGSLLGDDKPKKSKK